MHKLHSLFRLGTGLALLTAIGWQIVDRVANDVFRPTEYFSYVTIQSSILAGVIFVVGAVRMWNWQKDSMVFSVARLSVTGFAVIVGVVYNLMLRDVAPNPLDANYEWPVIPNEILHVWGPILIVIDWFWSRRFVRMPASSLKWIFVYPILWITFTVVRGYVDGWWPYPFLDPNEPAGVVGMLIYLAVILIFFSVVSIGFWLTRSDKSRRF
ncbi:MAG: hypothetical protein RL038_1244 [Actinomycetota bacterium]